MAYDNREVMPWTRFQFGGLPPNIMPGGQQIPVNANSGQLFPIQTSQRLPSLLGPQPSPAAAASMPQSSMPLPSSGVPSYGGNGPSVGSWLRTPAFGGGQTNRLGLIGKMLSGAGQGLLAAQQPGAVPGSGLGLAAAGAGNALEQTKQQEYDQQRQQIMDLIAWKNATKDTSENKIYNVPQGGSLVDPSGKELFHSDAAPLKPDKPSENSEIIAKMNDPNLPPEERAMWKGIYDDKTRPPQGAQIKLPESKIVNTKDGRVLSVSADGQTVTELYAPKPQEGGEKLNPTEINIKKETEDTLGASGASADALKRAQELNEQARAGPLSDYSKYWDYLTDPKKYAATQELQNSVMQNVLGSLKSTFGGQPTEGERQVLIEVEGSINQPAEVRKKIYERAQKTLNDRIALNKKRLDEINTGQYGKTVATPPSPATGTIRKWNPATGKIE